MSHEISEQNKGADTGPNGSRQDEIITREKPGRILVVLPQWVGDVVMATPALKSLRKQFPEAHIAYLLRQHLTDLFTGCDWPNEIFHWPTREKDKVKRRQSFLGLAAQLREKEFDCAILMTNSFRSAMLARLAGIRWRVGYNRDGRGMLLTDKLLPDKKDGKYIPGSMIRYYNTIARYMGCPSCPELPELHTSPEDEAAVDQLLKKSGNENKPYIVLNVGASYGPAKCWLPERFAEVADQLVQQHNVGVFIAPGPKEISIARKVADTMQQPVTVTDNPVLPLNAIKALIRRSKLLITNDTGPRHFAVAMDTPVVTIFGPTDPRWTTNNYTEERLVMVNLDCQPCMKRTCPLDHHHCMTYITTDMVLDKANELLATKTAASSTKE